MSMNPNKLVDSQIDPLSSPMLLQELPGLMGAFDETAMRVYLQQALFDRADSSSTIRSCELEQATYQLDGGVVLRYLLTVDDPGSGQTHDLLVSGRLFVDQGACASYVRERLDPFVGLMAGREEVAPFGTPIAEIEGLHMAVAAFPIDAELPTLAQATDRRLLARVLGEVLADAAGTKGPVEECRVELVDYGRRDRSTLRYRLAWPNDDGAPQLVYGKLTADSSGSLAGDVTAALAAQLAQRGAGRQVRVPRVFAWLPDLHLSLLEALPGTAPIADLLKARLGGKPVQSGPLALEEMVEVCGQVAAAMHTTGLVLGPQRTLDDELAALGQELEPILRFSPDLGAQLQGWLEQLARVGGQSEPLPLCFNHGDFTHGQFLFDGAACGLIDFDSVCQAEPALDIGQFLTYLHIAGLKFKIAPEAAAALMDDLVTRFLRVYRAELGDRAGDSEQLRARVSVYRTISLLRRVLRSWQKFKPKRVAGALAVLEHQLDALDRNLEMSISRTGLPGLHAS
jgi:hypothetical protein